MGGRGGLSCSTTSLENRFFLLCVSFDERDSLKRLVGQISISFNKLYGNLFRSDDGIPRETDLVYQTGQPEQKNAGKGLSKYCV
jgi:hypothetical protein